jgi:hypothetical protein
MNIHGDAKDGLSAVFLHFSNQYTGHHASILVSFKTIRNIFRQG